MKRIVEATIKKRGKGADGSTRKWWSIVGSLQAAIPRICPHFCNKIVEEFAEGNHPEEAHYI